MAHWAGGPLTHVGQNGTAARRLGPASQPRRPILPEPTGAATRTHGVITVATATAVARPPAASPGARVGESDSESTGEAQRSRRADGWGVGGTPRPRGDRRRRFLAGVVA
jgi:hypothetical protein